VEKISFKTFSSLSVFAGLTNGIEPLVISRFFIDFAIDSISAGDFPKGV
jgi:hypothetical protein